MELTSKEKKTKALELQKYHQPVFDALGIKNPVFYPKPPFKPEGMKEKAIPMFPDQIKRLMGRDVYFECVDMSMEPEQDWEGNKRTLWKWKFDPEWKRYLKITSKGGSDMYMIPVSKLEKIIPWHEGTKINRHSIAEFYKEDPACPDPNRKVTDMTVGDLKCLLIDLIKQIKDE